MSDIAQRLRDTLFGGANLNRIPLCIEAADTIEAQAEQIRALREALEMAYRWASALTDLENAALDAGAVPDGEVVVSCNEEGQIVAVTRQDDEGRILTVIAESAAPPAPSAVPLTDEWIAACWHDTPWNSDLKTRIFHFARGLLAAAPPAPAVPPGTSDPHNSRT